MAVTVRSGTAGQDLEWFDSAVLAGSVEACSVKAWRGGQ